MTTAPAVLPTPGANGSAQPLAPPEREAFVEKLRGLVMGAAGESLAELIARIIHLERARLEHIVDQIPWLRVAYREPEFTSANGGTGKLKSIIMENISEALPAESAPKDAMTGDPAKGNGAVRIDAPVKRKRDRSKKGKARDKSAADLAPPLPQDLQVIQAMRDSTTRNAQEVRGLAEEMVRAAQSHKRIVSGAAEAHLASQRSQGEALGILAAAFIHSQRQQAETLKRIAEEADQGGAIQRGGAMFLEAVGRCGARSFQADVHKAVETEAADNAS